MTSGAVRLVGAGAVTGAGRGVAALWDAVRAARPGLADHPNALGDPRLDPARYVRALDFGPNGVPNGSPDEGEPAASIARAAMDDALGEAAAVTSALPGARVALFGGTSLGGMSLYEAAHRRWWDEAHQAGPGLATSPLSHARARYDGPIAHLARDPVTAGGWTINTACSSSANALGLARLWLSRGRIDVAVVVGVDVVSPFVYAGFGCLNAVDPEASRPFRAERRGLNLGDAAVALVWVRSEDARLSPAVDTSPAVDIVGYGSSCDAYHLTRPDPKGTGLVRAIHAALRSAGAEPDSVSAIAAHATGTPSNDAMESAAFTAVFGPDRCPPVHANKPVTGHTLGAAGALNVLVLAEALRRRELPPTFAPGEPDPALAAHPTRQPTPLGEAAMGLSTSSGFGGSNAALVVRRCP